MFWILFLVPFAASVAGVLLVGKAVLARHLRSVHWNDLHERGKLFAAQLAATREVEAKKTRPEPRKPPRSKAEKARYFWPQRAALLAGPPSKGTQPRPIATAWN